MNDRFWLAPELILIACASLVVVGGAFWRHRVVWAVASSVGMVAAACALLQWQGAPLDMISDHGPVDSLGAGLRWLAVGLGLLLVMMAARPAAQGQTGEMLGLILLVTVGLMLACSANELVLMLLGLELISIPSYALLYLGRHDQHSGEAALKYFFLSLLSSALFLLGLSLLYGLTGAMRFDELNTALVGARPSRMAWLSVCLLFAGLGFKVAVVPFHFYAPDVYMATTNLNAGLLAVIPKVAGMAVMIRFACVFAPVCPDFVWQLLIVVSLLTMTIGNFCALWQTNIRRLLAYSSIAHAGYMLIGIAVAVASAQSAATVYDGLAATLLYLTVYAFASLGTFAVLSEWSSSQQEANTLDQVSGMAAQRPWLAGAFAMFVFSLAGIPPLAGFWGKLALFGSALSFANTTGDTLASSWFLALVIVGLLNAAVGAAYYLRMIGAVYFGSPLSEPSPTAAGSASVAATICALLIIGIGLLPTTLVRHCQQVGESLHLRSIQTQPAVESVATLQDARSASPIVE